MNTAPLPLCPWMHGSGALLAAFTFHTWLECYLALFLAATFTFAVSKEGRRLRTFAKMRRYDVDLCFLANKAHSSGFVAIDAA